MDLVTLTEEIVKALVEDVDAVSVKEFPTEEENVMLIDGVKVYVYSWRTPAGENADRLFGMYAISADGKDFYEYQSAREEWILDVDG